MNGAIIVAAGTSSRMGGIDKQFAPLAGWPVVAHALHAFATNSNIDAIVMVVNPATAERARQVAEQVGRNKVVALPHGGARRQDSAESGLAALESYAASLGQELEFVLIHDGARPLVSSELINRGLSSAAQHGAAICAIPCKETVKVVGTNDKITSTPDRSHLWIAQTPQVFRYALLRGAYDKARERNLTVTDDAALLEALGTPVFIFEGAPNNIKVTTPADLIVADALLRSAALGHN